MPPGTLDQWRELLEPRHEQLRSAAADVDTPTPAAIESLRRRWPPALVALALELAAARRRASAKFRDAASLVADVQGVQQATSETVARHKAERMAAARPARILDLCCGIGGDAMALASLAPTQVVDADPVRAWMAGHNAEVETVVAEVEALDPGPHAVHLDPDRRSRTGRRAWRYQDYRPGPACIARLVEVQPAAAVKLGPGVDLDALPPGEVELISECGRLVQAVLWTGSFTPDPRRRTATRLPEGDSVCGRVGELPPLPLVGDAEFEGVLLVPDPALERAGLVGAAAAGLGLTVPHPGPGLLTAAAPPPSPWFTPFLVRARMPWRPSRVRRWLAGHGAGLVEVKTRGGAVDTDAAARHLRGRGDEPFTVFVVRMGTAVQAVVATRVADP